MHMHIHGYDYYMAYTVQLVSTDKMMKINALKFHRVPQKKHLNFQTLNQLNKPSTTE